MKSANVEKLVIFRTAGTQQMSKTRSIAINKRVALVAHDKKKEALLQWAERHKEFLQPHQLFYLRQVREIN